MDINEVIFEPMARWRCNGGERQRCITTFNERKIIWESFFPRNFFKPVEDWYIVDIILPVSAEVTNGEIIEEAYYSEPGYGYPKFNSLEAAAEYIKEF